MYLRPRPHRKLRDLDGVSVDDGHLSADQILVLTQFMDQTFKAFVTGKLEKNNRAERMSIRRTNRSTFQKRQDVGKLLPVLRLRASGLDVPGMGVCVEVNTFSCWFYSIRGCARG